MIKIKKPPTISSITTQYYCYASCMKVSEPRINCIISIIIKNRMYFILNQEMIESQSSNSDGSINIIANIFHTYQNGIYILYLYM